MLPGSAQTGMVMLLMMRGIPHRETEWLKPPKIHPRAACMLAGRWELMLPDALGKGEAENEEM